MAPWLWLGLLGLALWRRGWLRRRAGAGRCCWPGRCWAWLGLLASGFAIGARGWSFEAWAAGSANWRQPVRHRPGRLSGAAGPADAAGRRPGAARLLPGDLFVAGAVVLCAALLLLFVALPVAKSLIGAFLDEAGAGLAGGAAERLGHERVWGLSCLGGGVRCGVAWNTLFLALLTAAGTTVLGTLIALLAERGGPRAAAGR
jgi:iron(III) transport system permease protein